MPDRIAIRPGMRGKNELLPSADLIQNFVQHGLFTTETQRHRGNRFLRRRHDFRCLTVTCSSFMLFFSVSLWFLSAFSSAFDVTALRSCHPARPSCRVRRSALSGGGHQGGSPVQGERARPPRSTLSGSAPLLSRRRQPKPTRGPFCHLAPE